MPRSYLSWLLILASLSMTAIAGWAEKAPEFRIAKTFNAPVPEIKSLASLKGKIVYLEFWATWCGPCVAEIPRMNRLAEAFKNEPVVFLSVTDESPDKIAAFLKTREMKTWVGVDEKKSSFKAYRVAYRPEGYLIGKKGELLARVSPDNLSEDQLRDAIAGKFKPALGGVDMSPPDFTAPPSKILFEITISSPSGQTLMMSGQDTMEGHSYSFVSAAASIWDIDTTQILTENLTVDALNFRLHASSDTFPTARELMKQAVLSTFNLAASTEQIETDVFLLSVSTGAARPAKGTPELKSGIMRSGAGKLLGKAAMPDFARALWRSAGRPVVDDTHLTGEYFIDIEWSNGNSDLGRALESVGLRLIPARRKIEYVRFKAASPTK